MHNLGLQRKQIGWWSAKNIMGWQEYLRIEGEDYYSNRRGFRIDSDQWNPLENLDQALMLVKKVSKSGYNYFYDPKSRRKHIVNLNESPKVSFPGYQHIRGESSKSMAEALTFAAIIFANCKNIEERRWHQNKKNIKGKKNAT